MGPNIRQPYSIYVWRDVIFLEYGARVPNIPQMYGARVPNIRVPNILVIQTINVTELGFHRCMELGS